MTAIAISAKNGIKINTSADVDDSDLKIEVQ
jgi:hypothetical protein